jgi:hypothetical protein
VLESQIKSIQEEMRLDSHRTDLKEQTNELRKDIEEKSLRRGVIDAELAQLRKGALAGVCIQGRRPDVPAPDDESVTPASESNSRVDDSGFFYHISSFFISFTPDHSV